MLNLVVKHIF